MPMPVEIFKAEIAGFPIILEGTHRDTQRRPGGLFRVTYGAQVDELLTYERAAAKLGQAIMHACACEGRSNAEG